MHKNIDINEMATVILTNYGQKILNNYRECLQSHTDNTELKASLNSSYCCDKNGKYTTEIWQLMFIFGQDMQSENIFLHNKIYIK